MFKKLKETSLYKWSSIFYQRIKMTNISDSAVVLAFYTLLSLFPLMIVLGSLLNLLGVSYSHLIYSLYLILPTRIYTYLRPLVYSALKSGGKASFSIGILITIWSASRVLAAFQRTTNLAYGLKRRNAITNRLSSLLWMLIFMFGLVGIVFFWIFSEKLLAIVVQYCDLSNVTFEALQILHYPFTLFIFFAMLCVMYYLIPKAKVKIKYIWQGAMFATILANILSKAFSLYLKYFSNSFSIYKAMSIFIILMFWLYLFGIIILSGAVINATFQQYFQKAIPTRNRNIAPKIKKIVKNQVNHSHKR